MKTFTGYRKNPPQRGALDKDPSQPQYEGVVFSDGKVALRWLTGHRSISIWDSLDDLIGVHGHIGEYKTELHWDDGTVTYLDKKDEQI